MSQSDKKKAFQITCPCCHAELWIDSLAEEVIKSEKGTRKKGSLDDLLLKEKKRIDEFDHKFEAAAELEREKRKKTQEKFKKAFDELNEKD